MTRLCIKGATTMTRLYEKGPRKAKKKLYIKNIASFEVFVVAVCGTLVHTKIASGNI
jgi:hypothetical protein